MSKKGRRKKLKIKPLYETNPKTCTDLSFCHGFLVLKKLYVKRFSRLKKNTEYWCLKST